MCPTKFKHQSIAQTCIVLYVPTTGYTVAAVLILTVGRIILISSITHAHTNCSFSFKPVEHHIVIRIEFVVVTNGGSAAFRSQQLFITKSMIVQLSQARHDVEITTTCVQGIVFGNIPTKLVAEGIMAVKVFRTVMTDTAGQCQMRQDFPIALQEEGGIGSILVYIVVLALAVFNATVHGVTIGMILEVIAEQLVFLVTGNRHDHIRILTARFSPGMFLLRCTVQQGVAPGIINLPIVLQGNAVAVIHTYIITAIYEVSTSVVGANSFIVYSQLISIIKSIFKLSTAALGIVLTRPYLAATVLGRTGNGSVMINIVADLVLGSLGIEVISLFTEVAAGNINYRLGFGRFTGDDVNNTALSTAAIHGCRTAAQYFHALNVIHVVHECCKHITAAAGALEVINSYAIDKDNYVLAAVQADAAQISIQAVSAIIQELCTRNSTQSLLYVFHMHLFNFFTANNAHICFSLQNRLFCTGSSNNDRSQLKAHFIEISCCRLRCSIGGYSFHISRLRMLYHSSCFCCRSFFYSSFLRSYSLVRVLCCRLSIESMLFFSNSWHCFSLHVSSSIFLNCCALARKELLSFSLAADFLSLLRQTVQCKAQAAAELPVMLVICAISA